MSTQARFLWEHLSERARYWINKHTISGDDFQYPIDVLVELIGKSYWSADMKPEPRFYKAVHYGYDSRDAYSYTPRTQPRAYIGTAGTWCTKTPLAHIQALPYGITGPLRQAGIITVGDWLHFRQQHGHNWHFQVKGIGPRRADMIADRMRELGFLSEVA